MRRYFLAVAFTLAAAVVACGLGGDPEPTPTPAPPPGAAQPELDGFEGALFIPSIEVGAPVGLKPWVVGEALPSPDGANDVAMYDFGDESRLGGLPGQGGNIVLSGRSLALAGCEPAEPPCNGVFTALFRIEAGAEIELLWRGETYKHQVVAMCNVLASAFVDNVYANTGEEQLTLLTGTGNLDLNRGWTHVLIVIAKPAPRTSVEPCPLGTEPGRPR
jgi:hypothetical protein